MLLIGLTAAIALAVGLATWIIEQRRPQMDLAAPRISSKELRADARRHRHVVELVRASLDPKATTGIALGVAGVIIAAVTIIVGLLLVMIHTNTGLARFDHGLAEFGARHATTVSTRVLNVVSQLGGAVVLVPLGVVVALVEAIRLRSLLVVAFLVVVVGGQFLVANLTKWGVHRARPTIDQLGGFSGSSFPSGHAMAAAACFAAFALVIGRRRGPALQRVLFAVAVGLAVAIALTRVWLGVHWLTDILAGLAMGWAWFALCSIAFGGRQLRFGAPIETAQRAIRPIPTATRRDT